MLKKELRAEAALQEGNLSWLKARMAALTEVSADGDAQRNGDALNKLCSDFKALLASLLEAEKMLLALGDCAQFREEVQTLLEDLVLGQREAQSEVSRILDCPSVREAQQQLLSHQQLLKRLRMKRKEVQQLILRGQTLQGEEGVGGALQTDLHLLETTVSKMEQNTDSQEQSLEVRQVTVEKESLEVTVEKESLEVSLAAWQEFTSQQGAVQDFLLRARSSLDRDQTFSSPESLSAELDQAQVLLKQSAAEASHMNTLLKRAKEIQLGPNNRDLLLEQARTLSGEVGRVEAGLNKDVQTLQQMKTLWMKFSQDFEAFSLWISEKEKQLEVLKSSSLPLEEQISTVKAVSAELQAQRGVSSQLEGGSQALSQFVSSGEGSRIKARLTQIGRYWEELQESVQQQEEALQESATYLQRFTCSLQQMDSSLSDLQKQLHLPLKSCSSSSETYRALQDHMEVLQQQEALRGGLLSLQASARRLRERPAAERSVTELNVRYEESLQEARDSQRDLEELLTLWRRFEKQRSHLTSCLERSEAASHPESQLLSADRAKLRAEIQDLQGVHEELLSLQTPLSELQTLGQSLSVSASEEREQQLQGEIQSLQRRLQEQRENLPQRVSALQTHLSLLDQFDQDLLLFSSRSETLLCKLHSAPAVNIRDLQPTHTHCKESHAALQQQSGEMRRLQEQLEHLCLRCEGGGEGGEAQLLRSRAAGGLQPQLDALQTAELQTESLQRLHSFLQKHSQAGGVLRGLRETLEGRGVLRETLE
ncbi:nesprin-1-like, partial [Trematomus bernacchii]|uniref:nesprin-1-like n=1 Tax=Trematomus bernacchii TaxID=40690 RepID=UPI00146C65A6